MCCPVSATAANRAKDHFLALVSHELRSPLAGIRIWTKLLRRGTLGPQEAARALEIIERSTLLQMRLVACDRQRRQNEGQNFDPFLGSSTSPRKNFATSSTPVQR